jgi:hypothetical protein
MTTQARLNMGIFGEFNVSVFSQAIHHERNPSYGDLSPKKNSMAQSVITDAAVKSQNR